MTTKEPVPAVAVSPDDQSSDRVQSDADQAVLVDRAAAITNQADSNRVQADADQVITVDRLDRLIEASRSLSASAVDVAASTQQEMQIAARARRRFTITMFLMVVLTFALLVPLLWLTLSGVRDRAKLKDCVSPTGKCFQDEAARRNTFVMNLEKVTVLANSCSIDPAVARLPESQRIVVIRKCIEAGLK